MSGGFGYICQDLWSQMSGKFGKSAADKAFDAASLLERNTHNLYYVKLCQNGTWQSACRTQSAEVNFTHFQN